MTEREIHCAVHQSRFHYLVLIAVIVAMVALVVLERGSVRPKDVREEVRKNRDLLLDNQETLRSIEQQLRNEKKERKE